MDNDTVYDEDDDMQGDTGCQDEDQGYKQGFDDGYQAQQISWNMGWNNFHPGPGPMNRGLYSRRNNNGYMNNQYRGAFGNYRGGYGPGGGYGPPRPGMWSRRPGPMGPPGPMMPPFQPGPAYPPRHYSTVHYAVKFLLRCQVPKENMKGLPRQLLEMIKPDYCGLCAQSLDSFDIAKIHYNCKNHLKTQKKFLTQHNKGRNMETQLKARSLYCELCDVHITSQAHADSHYSGKTHRAVVDGRKAPKNPILLQKGMEGRVTQLIRREKKQLKAAAETEPDETTAPGERITPPELICEICNTSVTNSEQMTNHLNGKKHLTKEKQHILKMMKGDTNKNKQKMKEANNEEAAEEGEGEDADGDLGAAEEEESAAEEEGDDWGTGEEWEGQTQDVNDYNE